MTKDVHDEVAAFSTTQLTATEYQNSQKYVLDPAADCVRFITGKAPQIPSTLQGRDVKFNLPMVRLLDQARITTLVAPSLGCITVEHVVDWKPATPNSNTSALKADTLTLGEPDASLFDVPSTYVEMAPSAAEAHLKASTAPVPADRIASTPTRWANQMGEPDGRTRTLSTTRIGPIERPNCATTRRASKDGGPFKV